MMRATEEFLLADIPRYCGIMNCIRRGTARIVARSERGLFIREAFSGIYFLASPDAAETEKLLASYPLAPGDECEVFTAGAAEYIQKTYPRATFTECRQYVYLGKEPPEYEKRLDMRAATPDDLPFVRRHYHLVDEDMLVLAVERRELFVARAGNVKVGFIGVHAEGCMGMLYVLPRFRRCGYGREMELFMTGEMMRAGLYPYGQVFISNKASLALQKTTDYEKAQCEMYWFIIK